MSEWEQAPIVDEGWKSAPLVDEPQEQSILPEVPPSIRGPAQEMYNMLNRRQVGVDYFTGVEDTGFRADFSKMDTEPERAHFLDKKVGKENWGRDQYGSYVVSPQAMEKLGLEHRGYPVALDEHRFTVQDIADYRGDAPTIAGAVTAGILTGGMGFVPAVALTALGAAGGKGIGEAVEALQGENIPTGLEVGKDIAEEAAKVLVEETLAWFAESAKLSATPYDDMALVVLPLIKDAALGLVDKIDGQVG